MKKEAETGHRSDVEPERAQPAPDRAAVEPESARPPSPPITGPAAAPVPPALRPASLAPAPILGEPVLGERRASGQEVADRAIQASVAQAPVHPADRGLGPVPPVLLKNEAGEWVPATGEGGGRAPNVGEQVIVVGPSAERFPAIVTTVHFPDDPGTVIDLVMFGKSYQHMERVPPTTVASQNIYKWEWSPRE